MRVTKRTPVGQSEQRVVWARRKNYAHHGVFAVIAIQCRETKLL